MKISSASSFLGSCAKGCEMAWKGARIGSGRGGEVRAKEGSCQFPALGSSIPDFCFLTPEMRFEPIKSMVSRGLSPENAEEKYSYVQCLASTVQLIMIQYAMTKTAMSESSGCGKLSCLWRGAILAIVL